MPSEAEVKNYMRDNQDVCTDSWNEVNVTQLAELACARFDTYGPPPCWDIPEEYFDWALEVVEGW